MESNGTEKKSFNFFGLILVVLLAAGCAIGGYFVGVNANKEEIKETDNEDVNEENEETIESKTPEKNSKYTFVKEYEKIHSLNNKNVELLIYYYKDSEEWTYGPSVSEPVSANIVRMDLFVNGSKIIDSEIVLANTDNTYTEQFINTNPNDIIAIDLFKDSSNDDEYYAMNLGEISIVNSVYEEKFIYLFTYDGKLLSSFRFWNSSGVTGIYGTQDMVGDRTTSSAGDTRPGMYKLYNYDLVDLHEKYIYAIEKGATCDSAIEYRYTVEDGKVKSTHSRTYTYEYIDGVGQC